MKSNCNLLEALNTEPYNYRQSSNKSLLREMFSNQTDGLINSEQLYLSRFGYIPNSTGELDVNTQMAYDFIKTKYSKFITDYHYTSSRNSAKEKIITSSYLILFDDLLIEFNFYYDFIGYLYNKTSKRIVDELIDHIRTLQPTTNLERMARVRIITRVFGDYNFTSVGYKHKEVDVKSNYNDDIIPICSIILKQLNRSKQNRLILLHGDPGTGKTSFLHYLINYIPQYVVLVPAFQVDLLLDASIITQLYLHPNSVIIIEDAENIVNQSTAECTNILSKVFTLLDGLLSNGVEIKIICTFNTKISSSHPILKANEHLIAEYEFKPLQTSKANLLSRKLGYSNIFLEPTLLSDIYNQTDADFRLQRKKTIGF